MSEITLARRIARYGCAFPQGGLPKEVVACVKQRVVDSLACVFGAYDAKPTQSVRELAAALPAPYARVFGTTLRTSPELAAFANSTMVRFLDYNDGYMGREPGHPSDNIPGCLAVAEAEGATGIQLIEAVALAYEIQVRLQDAASLNKRGWDHVNYVNVSMAVAAAKLMKLSEEQTEHAINLSLNGHIAMRQVRSGSLSDWKGCSAANAVRNAIFAAQMARAGITGPSPIFEGSMGFFSQVSGEFELDTRTFANDENRDFAILRTLTKTFPTNGELHTAVWAGIELGHQIDEITDIASILIETSEFNKRVLADTQEKWCPRTRETADHSLPYNVARAILDGDISLESYTPEKIADPVAAELMAKTSVREDPELTDLFPKFLANRVIVRLSSGGTLVSENITGPGSVETPMTDADFERKLRRMAAPHIGAAAQDQVLDFVKDLDKQADYMALFNAMVPRQ